LKKQIIRAIVYLLQYLTNREKGRDEFEGNILIASTISNLFAWKETMNPKLSLTS